MLSKSSSHNPNYLAKVVSLQHSVKHPNADRMLGWVIDGNRVWTDLERKEGDIGVYFPLECQIHAGFLSALNLYSDANLNINPEIKGYFDSKGRVRAVKLRGAPSMGFFLPWSSIEYALGADLGCPKELVGTEFDTINDELLVKKYVPKTNQHTQRQPGTPKLKKKSRLVEGQFRKHVDTSQLRKNAHCINPDDYIIVSYKLHGTSFVVGNLLTKRKLSRWEKICRWFGTKIREEEYNIIYSSRNVIQNEFEKVAGKDTYYGTNVYKDVADEIGSRIMAGLILYGEAVGYTRTGGWIQKDYDYGYIQPLTPEEYKEGVHYGIYIYRITFTNPEGKVIEMSDRYITEYCEAYGLRRVPVLAEGLAKEMFPGTCIEQIKDNQNAFSLQGWQQSIPSQMEKEDTYRLEKDCNLCRSKVPAEGVVLRKDKLFTFEAYKLKAFRFLEKETKDLDEGIVDLETEQS